MASSNGHTSVARLQVSVIEARNVQADMSTSPDFYVKLKLSGQEFRTDVVRGTASPKFLKDARLEVTFPETEALKVELLQVSPQGDLVMGSGQIAVKPLVETGTLVQWFNLTDATGACTAELCLVLRYSTGEKAGKKSRSKSPAPRSVSPARAEAPPAAGRAKKGKGKKSKKAMALPLPLAIAAGVCAGCLAFLWSRRPVYYEVKEGDTLCKIGLCFNRPHQDLYAINSKIISDPNVIYPGDRIKIV